MYDALLGYMFEDIEPKLDGLSKGIWINLKMPLDTSKINISNAEVEQYQSVNRGVVNNSKSIITGCNIKELYVSSSGEASESPATGTVKNISLDITGGEITLYAGDNNEKPLDIITAKEIINTLKISRTTVVNYGNKDTLSVLGDIIKIK